MIEIRKSEDATDYKGHHVYIDGVLLSKDQGHASNYWGDDEYELNIYDAGVKAKLSNLSFAELMSGSIRILRFFDDRTFQHCHLTIIEKFALKGDSEVVAPNVRFEFDVNGWTRPWSIRDFIEELERIWRDHPIEEAGLEPLKPDLDTQAIGFVLECPVSDLSSAIEAEERKWLSPVKGLLQSTCDALTAKIHHDSIVTYFNFPPETRVACEQYLLYFVQFLKDLGVEASAELQQEAGRVLFTVTPADRETALDKIQQALEVYLQLPTHPELNISMSPSGGIEEQRLIANISHLNGQLALANAVIQAKDARIEAQTISIRQLMQGEVFIQSAQHESGKTSGKDKEDLLGGAVSLKPYEGKGFDINLPMIFRRLREMFSRKD